SPGAHAQSQDGSGSGRKQAAGAAKDTESTTVDPGTMSPQGQLSDDLRSLLRDMRSSGPERSSGQQQSGAGDARRRLDRERRRAERTLGGARGQQRDSGTQGGASGGGSDQLLDFLLGP
ncbi:MAG TPA: hypothetical protein VGR10_03940, partial [Thermoleophilaceae bacterium]|nr:hypothetical protein [Thermoleophilaceae bacterium]